MEPSHLIKVVAAFVAGVVVALGSALIYVRVNEMAHPQPAVQTIPAAQNTSTTPISVPATDQDASDRSVPGAVSQSPAPEPAPKVHAKKRKTLRAANRQVATPQASLPYESGSAPVEIAQNSPADPVIDRTELPRQPDPQPAAPEFNPPPAPAPQVTPQPHVVTLQAGTNLTIRLGETLSTDHNYSGDTFRATLDSPIVLDGFIIADRGSKVLGRIVNAQKAGRIEGVSDLTLALTEINTTDGQRVRIGTSAYDKKGPSNTGENTAKIAGGAALGAIIGAIAGGGKGAAIGAGAGGAAGTGAVIATHGKAAVLPAETRLTFRLASPVTITEQLNH